MVRRTAGTLPGSPFSLPLRDQMNKELIKILRQCLKKDRRAQFKLYQHCYPFLMSICFRYQKQHEDAEALLNEGFLKVLLNLKNFDFNREFNAWAAAIMIRTAIDQYRAEKKYNAQTDLEDQDSTLERESIKSQYLSIDKQMTTKEVQELIFSLPEYLRMVFNLYEMEGYKHKEIAEMLGISERSSKRHLKKAKNILKEKLALNAQLKKVI